MRRLSNTEIERALSAILPNPIIEKTEPSHNNENLDILHKVANYDLARGMLNHETYRLVERINTVDSATEQSKVIPSNLDNLLLTFSLTTYKRSKEQEHSGDILFSLPPFSFAYPLLLSYHLVLNHLSSNLIENDTYKFTSGSGILIITDNIELLSHIWRTNINNNYLREFLPVFTLEAGKFKKFNFNGESNKRRKIKEFDGSLPWLTMFRAYRSILPESLEHQPEVIIIDLLPFRHRKRAKALVNWAKNHSKHVIVIAPSHDSILSEINDAFLYHIPINKVSIREIEAYFHMENTSEINPITASWTVQSSLPYLSLNKKIINIVKSKTTSNEFYETVKIINNIFKNAKTKSGSIPISFKKLQHLFLKILNVCVPLEWYERTRWVKEEPTLLELINRWSKIPPTDREESIIYDTLMPHFYENIIKVYDFIKGLNINVRSQLLIKILETKIKDNTSVTIIVSDPIDQEELKVWINSIHSLDKKKVAAITVITQKDWANQQWKEIYFNQQKESDLIIVTSPWQQKYLSSFYFRQETEIIMLDAYMELNLIKYQINQISQSEGIRELWNTFDSLFYTEFSMKNDETKPFDFNIIVEEKPVRFVNGTAPTEPAKGNRDTTVGELFDDQILINMFTIDEDFEEEEIPLSEIHLKPEYELVNKSAFIECIKVISENQNIVYVPIDMNIRVKKFNQTEIQSISPYELKKNDIWIKVKEKKKRELFEEILKLASNTLLMKWINTNVTEWRMMVKEVWQQYYSPGKYNKHIYEEIKCDINRNGGQVESHLTIANWINGGLVRSIDNLRALATLSGSDHFIKRVKIIYKSMRELWGIHIKLGRSLGKLIDEHVNENINSNPTQEDTQWINLGQDIVIPVDDILNAIELIKVYSVEVNETYLVNSSITERNIETNMHDILLNRGMIKYDG